MGVQTGSLRLSSGALHSERVRERKRETPPPSACTLCLCANLCKSSLFLFSVKLRSFSAARRGQQEPVREIDQERPSSGPGRAARKSRKDHHRVQWEMNLQNTANGGRFNFDDGGTYIGGWEDGKVGF